MIEVRPATPVDRPAIEALLAPEIARGTVLPRVVDPADFLVAAEGGSLLGAVALTAWSGEVVELGALVSAAGGRGVGAALVEAALEEAGRRGHREVVALTGIPAFFERLGWQARPRPPHALARGEAAPRLLDAGLEQAIEGKARRCAACPRLSGCAQTLLSTAATAQPRRACA